jgi:hypothetical protein
VAKVAGAGALGVRAVAEVCMQGRSKKAGWMGGIVVYRL